ncbi:MAG: hypothetical protein FWD57_16715, partial [Polyangiaceae bacterium]|nr:hypothetical protein [Polyangiaceae bacterium]
DGIGDTPIALLRTGNYDRVVTMLGVGPGRLFGESRRLSDEDLRRVYDPLPPRVLVDARQDPVDFACGRVRAGKSVKHRGYR